jgi:hypothetical protein
MVMENVTTHEHTMVYSCDDTVERPDSGTASGYRSETNFEHAHEDGHLPHHHTMPQGHDDSDADADADTDTDTDTDTDSGDLEGDIDKVVEEFDSDVTGLWA